MNKWYRMVSENTWTKLKGVTKGSPLSISPAEAKEYFIAMNISNIEGFDIKPYQDTFVYELTSRFSFGKFKGNELGCVYKISPDYIEWCMINAEGFIIHPNVLKLMQKEKVFVLSDVLKFASEETNSIKINLSGFNLNESGFPNMPNVREENFSFSQFALNKNQEKLTVETELELIEKGADWHNKNYNSISSELRRKKHISIVPPRK